MLLILLCDIIKNNRYIFFVISKVSYRRMIRRTYPYEYIDRFDEIIERKKLIEKFYAN